MSTESQSRFQTAIAQAKLGQKHHSNRSAREPFIFELLAFSLLPLAKEEPRLDPARDQPVPANAAYFANFLKDAAEPSSLKAQNHYLLSICQGDAARRFYEKLGTVPE